MILELLGLSFLTGLFCNGLQIATGEGMILEPVKKRLDKIFIRQRVCEIKRRVSKIYYPILYCIKCMPSLWGTVLCLFLLPPHVELFFEIPIVIICGCCFSVIINQQHV